MPGFQSTRLATEGALEPFFFLYTDDSIQGNPETCKQGSIMLNYEVKNNHTNTAKQKYKRNFSTLFREKGRYMQCYFGEGGKVTKNDTLFWAFSIKL